MIMNNQEFSALYYPTIEFTDPQWLWSASLFWDRIYRIVPKGYAPADSRNVVELCDNGEIGVQINPDNYSAAVADEFLNKVREHHWHAAALSMNYNEEYDRLHSDKVDVRLRQMIISKGGKESKDKWLHVPNGFASHYMIYLASHIANKNKLNLITDVSPAWTATTYYTFDDDLKSYFIDELPNVLASIIVREFVPTNLLDIRPKDILAFREKRRDERRRFVQAVRNAAPNLSNCKDPVVVKGILEDVKKDITSSLDEYKRSMDILKVKNWTGLKTISFPAAAPVMNMIMPLGTTQLAILSTTGLALGVLAGIAALKGDAQKLINECEFSYLISMRKEWKKCSLHGGDYNAVLNDHIEEFIND